MLADYLLIGQTYLFIFGWLAPCLIAAAIANHFVKD